jgi:hypothetical protein
VSIARIIVLSALGLLGFAGAAYGLSESLGNAERTTSVVSQRVHSIVVNADAGDVDIRAGLTGTVTIDRTDHWLLDRPEVSQELRDGTLTISSACNGIGFVLRCETDFQIAAPPGVDVDVKGTSGDITLRGLNGRVTVETDAGDIEADRVEPVTLHATTNAGNISLDLFGQPTRTAVHSDAGDVNVVVPYGAYRVDGQADAGDVKVTGLLRDDLSPRRIEARTDAGDIVVRAR